MADQSRTVDLAPAFLEIRADVASANDEDRTVDVVFTTGAGVERMDYWTGKRYVEKLSLDPAHVRLDRLNAGAPVLDSHSSYSLADQMGVVVDGSAKLAKTEGRATLRFSKRDEVTPRWNDIRAGIIRNVSIGYRVRKFEETQDKNEIPVRTAIDWEPYEISMVPMPADAGAQVRSDRSLSNPCVIVTRAGETPMADVNQDPQQPTERTAAAAAPAPAASPDAAAVATAERARILGIQDAVRIGGLEPSVATDLVQRNVALDEARAEIFRKMADKEQAETPDTQSRIAVTGEDSRDKWLRGATSWLLTASGAQTIVRAAASAKKFGIDAAAFAGVAGDPAEFRGLTLLDLAKECLTRAGVSHRGLSKMEVVAKAFTTRANVYQSVSDFATLLENTLHKSLQAAYATTPDTWSRFCHTSTVTDFRAHPRYRWGNLTSLDSLSENGEFKNKGLSDAEKATITASTKGNIVSISRQMIVNDDMNAFARLPQMLGRAAALSIEIDVYALLAQNAGLGPTLADGIVLFNASHNNITTGAALSAAAIDADRVAMASQKEVNGVDYLDMRPAVLVIGIGLGGQARVINLSQYDPDNTASGSKAVMKPNVVAGLFRDVVDSPRVTSISATRRYLFADPSIAPVLEVGFLEGYPAPVLETQDAWRTDGAEMRVRFDYGTAAVDYRGAVTNAGV